MKKTEWDGFTIKCVKGVGYNNFYKQTSEVDINVRMQVVNSVPFNYHLPHELWAETEEHSWFSGEKTVLISADCGNRIFFGVPNTIFNNVSNFITGRMQFSEQSDFLSFVSDYAYNQIYLEPRYKVNEQLVTCDKFNIDDYARKNLTDYNTAKRGITEALSSYYIKIADFMSYVEHSDDSDHTNENILKWKKHSESIDEDIALRFVKFAIAKFEGKLNIDACQEVFKDTFSQKYRTDGSKNSAASHYAGKVKEYAREYNLPIWPENRGRKRAKKDQLPESIT